MNHRTPFHRTIIALTLCLLPIRAQQVADTEYKPPITKPAYAPGKGPLVLLDEAHHNFHTATGRYQTFAELLRRDGYVVQSSTAKFTKEALQPAKILVIANALNERNANNWTLPTPSAFTDEEVAAVRNWVNNGGALFLIADHMPFPGAAKELGAAFGIKFTNGYVRNQPSQGGPDVFQRTNDSLRNHPITNGRDATEKVDAVATFTGSAFQIPNAEPLLVLGCARTAATELRADHHSGNRQARHQTSDRTVATGVECCPHRRARGCAAVGIGQGGRAARADSDCGRGRRDLARTGRKGQRHLSSDSIGGARA
jgi:hypothetical protein